MMLVTWGRGYKVPSLYVLLLDRTRPIHVAEYVLRHELKLQKVVWLQFDPRTCRRLTHSEVDHFWSFDLIENWSKLSCILDTVRRYISRPSISCLKSNKKVQYDAPVSYGTLLTLCHPRPWSSIFVCVWFKRLSCQTPTLIGPGLPAQTFLTIQSY